MDSTLLSKVLTLRFGDLINVVLDLLRDHSKQVGVDAYDRNKREDDSEHNTSDTDNHFNILSVVVPFFIKHVVIFAKKKSPWNKSSSLD